MGKCQICKKESEFISSYLGLCLNCILAHPKESKKISLQVHANSRKEFGLTEKIPKAKNGLQCNGCGNKCKIPENERGFCGLVENKNNKLIRIAGTSEKGLCEWYYDSLPTNCVAAWACAACGIGYPKYSVTKGPEYEYYNLSVFYGTCNFNCLFCQNWHFRNNLKNLSPIISAEELAEKVNEKVTCICFFGGDPNPQLAHAIETSRLAVENSKGRILRICLETNGNANPKLLKKFAEISFESGGTVKFDLKVFDESLSFALSGVSNKMTLKNFKMLAKYHKKRPEVPFLHASTLLVPGYVEEDQVRKISSFISRLDKTIPYSLLAFWPTFFMSDLPLTSRQTAENCLKIAKEKLEKVRIGNLHLLK
jgi:pyruvate formate lyase activating enzyme